VPNAAIPGRWVNAIDLRTRDVLLPAMAAPGPITDAPARRVKMTVCNLPVGGLENYRVGHTVSSCITAAAGRQLLRTRNYLRKEIRSGAGRKERYLTSPVIPSGC
jgi:hypothetical protein